MAIFKLWPKFGQVLYTENHKGLNKMKQVSDMHADLDLSFPHIIFSGTNFS